MSDSTPAGEALEGYGVLAQQLLKSWTPFLTGAADKVAAGAYGRADAEADFSTFSQLVLDSMIATGSAFTGGLANASATYVTDFLSDTFEADPSLAGTERTLRLKGVLKSGSGSTVPLDHVTFVPGKLAKGEVEFALKINLDGVDPRRFDGVVLSKAANGKVEEIAVSVTVG